jgi:RND family efflux transporter MFP subunit
MKKAILVIALVAAGAWGMQKLRGWLPQPGAAEPPRPTTATVLTTNIYFAVSAAGDIGPAEQVSVRPEVNGRIDQLPVDIGDTVKKGQTLFTLDDRNLRIEEESRKKQIERSRLELEQAERNYRRSEQLYADKLISQELFEDARTQYELARNALERAQKDLELVQEQLTKTRIVAPFDCTVLTRPVSVGQAVSGSGGFNSGTEVLTIANLDDLVINAHINQADVTRLKVNQEVKVSVEAVPGLVVTGIVERIAPQATIKNNVKGFAARVLLRGVDKRVRPGMTANIQIPVAAADGVVAVPLAAVFTETNPETQQTERFAFVKRRDGTLERRSVEIGVSDNFYVEVLSGLAPGEVVALELTKEELARLNERRPEDGAFGATTARPNGGRPRGGSPRS